VEKSQIKNAILKSVGNPESGSIVDYADIMAQAVVDLLDVKPEVKKYERAKETRTIQPEEIRSYGTTH
jgi:hypothetical protein